MRLLLKALKQNLFLKSNHIYVNYRRIIWKDRLDASEIRSLWNILLASVITISLHLSCLHCALITFAFTPLHLILYLYAIDGNVSCRFLDALILWLGAYNTCFFLCTCWNIWCISVIRFLRVPITSAWNMYWLDDATIRQQMYASKGGGKRLSADISSVYLVQVKKGCWTCFKFILETMAAALSILSWEQE